MSALLTYDAAMEREERLAATARAIGAELAYRRYGVMLDPPGAACALSVQLAEVALLAADGDGAALAAIVRERRATADRLLAPDPCPSATRPALAVAGETL